MKLDSKKDIILAICPAWGVQMPPLGLACLSTDLKRNDIGLDVLDLNIEVYRRVDDKLKELWQYENSKHWCDGDSFLKLKELLEEEIRYCVERIIFSKAKILGLATYATNRLFTIEVIREIKRQDPDRVIIVGGRGCGTKEDRQIFPASLVDFFIVGEGEKVLFELIKGIKANCEVKNIPGIIAYGEEREIIPAFPGSLDSLSFPTFAEFSLDKYQEQALPLLMSRGCIGRCAFCDDWRMMGKYRIRSAEHMFEEIKYHVEQNKITNFYFNDPLINGELRELERLCDLIIEAKYKITWIALALPSIDMTYSLLVKMKKAGCFTLNYGIESGSDNVLRKMRKPISINGAGKVLKLTRKAGINTQLNFILGFPGEREEDIDKTIEFIIRNRANISGVTNINTCNAVVGCDLSLNSKKYGILFPPELELRDSHWYTLDGNTFGERKKGTEKVINVLKALRIPIFTTNLKEKSMELHKLDLKEKIADILLVTLPPWGVDNPPIGLGYLASYLKKNHLHPLVYDFNIYFHSSVENDFRLLWHIENKSYWSNEETFPVLCELFKKQMDYCVEKILNAPADIIGFSVVDPRERLTIEIIRRIKERAPDRKIILGGPATSTREQRKIFLDNVPDYIAALVIGEGEEALSELIMHLRKGKGIRDVKGVVVKNNGEWVYNPGQSIEPIEKVPFPTYEEFDLDLYGREWFWVEWSRGCRGRCSFCKNYKLVPGYRAKPAQRVIEELRYHVEKNRINDFFVADNLLNGDLSQLEEICDLIVKNGLRIRWAGGIAPRKDMDYKFFRKMYESGCYMLQIGVESGSNKVLRKMRKMYTAEVSERVVRAAKRAGMETEVFIMIGFPGEGEKEFRETYNFIKGNAEYIDTIKSINTLHLIAGTDVYNNYEKYNLKPLPKRNWHYLWETHDGNTYAVRKRRAQEILSLACDLGLNVMETNIEEGKEELLSGLKTENYQEKLERLALNINKLQELPKYEIKEKPQITQTTKLPPVQETELQKIRDELSRTKEELKIISGALRNIKSKFLYKLYKSVTYRSKRIFLQYPKLVFLFFLNIVTNIYMIFWQKIHRVRIFPGQ